jgi:hypothetical protein
MFIVLFIHILFAALCIQSAVHHIGRHAYAGHYVAHCVKRKSEGENDGPSLSFFRFDDAIVKEITPTEALGSNALTSSYLMFYSLKN